MLNSIVYDNKKHKYTNQGVSNSLHQPLTITLPKPHPGELPVTDKLHVNNKPTKQINLGIQYEDKVKPILCQGEF